MKTKQVERAAERPLKQHLQQLERLAKLAKTWPRDKAPPGTLVLKIAIPREIVPLFQAMSAVVLAPSPEAFAVWAITRGMVSEDALSHFDDLINGVL